MNKIIYLLCSTYLDHKLDYHLSSFLQLLLIINNKQLIYNPLPSVLFLCLIQKPTINIDAITRTRMMTPPTTEDTVYINVTLSSDGVTGVYTEIRTLVLMYMYI